MTRAGRTGRWALAAAALLLFTGFCALGTWQVQRRAWKLDLIERVEQRAHGAAVAVPAEAAWPAVTAATDEYRRVRLEGRYLPGMDARVQASTVLGPGFWVLTPLKLDGDGGTVIVNRGFVPPEAATPAPLPEGPVTVTGLLRISEPKGGFLRENDVAADRWFSRDVAAIAASRRLARVAPYFVDAEAAPAAAASDAPAEPVGGLTVIAFHNSHLVYAVTWYTLAAMVAGAAVLVRRAGVHNAKRHDDTRHDLAARTDTSDAPGA